MRYKTYKKRGGNNNYNKSIRFINPNTRKTVILPKKKPNSNINLRIKPTIMNEIEYSKQMIKNHANLYNKSIKNMKNAEKILSNGSPEKNVSNINYTGNLIGTARNSIVIATGKNDKNGHIQHHKKKLQKLLNIHRAKINNSKVKEIEELLERVKNF